MVYVGTSGYDYPHWVSPFYPSDLPQSERLSYFARHFSTVEINNSFYQWPSEEQFHHWSEQAKTGRSSMFLFAVKANRYVTHIKKLKDPEQTLARHDALRGLGRQLGPVLFQLPGRWRANPDRLKSFLDALPKNQRTAFEFRDRSWWTPQIFEMLNNRGCPFVLAVGGEAPTPNDMEPVGPFLYVRFHHGEHGIGFTDDELQIWADRLAQETANGRDAFVYFNNDAEGHAVRDAQRLCQLLGDQALSP